MGQKVDPRSLRLWTNRKFDSTWYANIKDYATYLHEDIKVREYIEKKYRHAEVSRVFITRTSENEINVTINTYKAGLILGRKGGDVELLKKELETLVKNRKVNIQIKELSYHSMDARTTALAIAMAIEKRMPYKRAMSQAVMKAKKNNIQGIKISVGGRLNGAEIARTESVLHGKVPLHSLKYEIDYATASAQTISGVIGVKVWLTGGEKC